MLNPSARDGDQAHLLADLAVVGLVALDETGRVTLWNRWMVTHSAIAATDALGRNFAEIFPQAAEGRLNLAISGAITKRLSSVVSPALNSLGLSLFETPTGRAERNAMLVSLTISPIPAAQGGGCLIQVVNVTSSVRRETLLRERLAEIKAARQIMERQREELLAVNKELDQFAYVASHDMRQPVRVITGLLQLIGREIGGQLDAQQKDMFDLVIGGAKRLDGMIIGLLDYSRAGQRGETEPVSLAGLVSDALLAQSRSIETAGAVVTVAGEESAKVIADMRSLVQVFVQLLDNALKYRDPERSLEISIGWRQDKNGWEAWVRDNGLGIASGGIEADGGGRIFQIFERMAPHGNIEGAGIGLAVARKTIECLGGRIWAQSEEGLGSTFFLWLPAAA